MKHRAIRDIPLSTPDGILRDDRAVSPVIGVILMVSVTVVLAAVIGTFVLDLGSRTGRAAPSVTLEAQDASTDFDPTSSGFQEMIVFRHEGGDRLTVEQVRMVVRGEGGVVLGTYEGGSWEIPAGVSDVDDLNLTLNGDSTAFNSDNFDDTAIRAGDEVVLRIDTGGSAGTEVDDGDEYTVLWIDTDSEKMVAESVVYVR